ncbi:hypothetical protein [Catellatospora sp. IY07-71]|uniref:hypothetical protein n=1 Tax=Catellatospora sp. IY07-71 TaxID=2728827 RepID=UPI001BB330A2|nr:hypothetical protein [Catellatospora sp. IY07-71]
MTPPPAEPAEPSPSAASAPHHPADSREFLAWALVSGVLGLLIAVGAQAAPWTVVSIFLLGLSLVCAGGHIAAVIAKQHALWREGRGR